MLPLISPSQPRPLHHRPARCPDQPVRVLEARQGREGGLPIACL